ncbi:hypothetical protein IE322_05620 [Pseudomonas asiatica]|uniref:hypothetical protein n=1 Tax=Pseudomonas asiatica TaxID=2219225 RepID=UPI0017488FE1|nr:hypothetical protein [Pseudomonas asiatica]QOE09541.1 hypothetical protein IE322_05620 [Pseudomonas asiatica]
MSQDQNRPTWLTASAISLALSVITSAATAGAVFGKLQSDLAAAATKNSEMQKTLEVVNGYNREWKDAYAKLQASFNTSELRVKALENDRCEPIRLKVDSISGSIEAAQTFGAESRLALLQSLSREYQESLRACYTAKGA